LASVTKGGVTLLAANEDSSANDYSSIITGKTFCLTPGSTYYVQADSYGALIAGSFLTINYQPIADSTASFTGLNPNYCVGSPAVTLAATPAGGTFTVNGSAATTFTPTIAGPNSVVYTFGGCAYTSTQSVTVNAKPIANLPVTISTCNASTLLDAGNPGSTYVWSTGATTQTITVSTNASYSVIVTNAAGCSSNDTSVVTLNSGVATSNISATSTSICAGTSTTLVGSPSGGVFSANGTGGVFNGVGAGTFDVTYTVTSSCGTAIDTVSITVNANPVAAIVPTATTICAGGTTGITLNSTPSGGTYSVVTGAASSLVGNVFNPATTGIYTIAYSVTNASGCPDSAQITFNVTCTVGLNDLSKGVAAIQVLPNPTSGNFDLNISNAADKATIKLLSFDGRLLSTEKVDLNQSNTVKMNIANYANGIYFVNVISGNVNKTIKITKQD
jgi:Secretion system C-terminal sorting domain